MLRGSCRFCLKENLKSQHLTKKPSPTYLSRDLTTGLKFNKRVGLYGNRNTNTVKYNTIQRFIAVLSSLFINRFTIVYVQRLLANYLRASRAVGVHSNSC